MGHIYTNTKPMSDKATRYFKFRDGTAFWKHQEDGINMTRSHEEVEWTDSICSLQDSILTSRFASHGTKGLIETTAEEAEP